MKLSGGQAHLRSATWQWLAETLLRFERGWDPIPEELFRLAILYDFAAIHEDYSVDDLASERHSQDRSRHRALP